MANPLPKPSLPGQAAPPAAAPMPKAPAMPPVRPAVPLPGQLPKPPAANIPAPQAVVKQGQAPSASTAKAKNSPLKFLPIIIGALVLLAVIIFVAIRFLGGGGSGNSVSVGQDSGTTQVGGQGAVVDTGKQVVLTYWGLWEPSMVVEEVLEGFGQENPGVIVEYKKHSHTEYRERLQSAISAGNGPDVFRFHASWAPMLRAELDSMPSSIMSVSEYKKDFYPVATEQLVSGNKVLGVPLMYDGLALYYNKRALEIAGIEVPSSWSQLKTAANKLTIRSEGKIERSGAALGTANNIEHFSDILALLMLQNGAQLDDPSSTEAQQALRFYTDFYSKSRVWDESMPNSTIAFAQGDVAMMLAPSWRAHEIQAINPTLDFDTAPVPKLTESRVAWASFWAEGVSSQSKNKDMAWKLIKYLSSEEILKKLYSTQSETRAFGEIYPRVDMAEELIGSDYVSAYLEDAPVATGWYMSSYTHDSGLNDRIIAYYEDAVNAMVSDPDIEPAIVMDVVASGSAQELRRYSAASSSR